MSINFLNGGEIDLQKAFFPATLPPPMHSYQLRQSWLTRRAEYLALGTLPVLLSRGLLLLLSPALLTLSVHAATMLVQHHAGVKLSQGRQAYRYPRSVWN